MTEQLDTIDYRLAVEDDEFEILDLYKEVAPEIPVPLENPKTEDAMITEIVQCRNQSWVAVDPNGKVVGFALARLDLHEKNSATALKCIGVEESSRGCGISSNLINKLKAKGLPVTASVLHDNKSAMAERLLGAGFTEKESDYEGETKYQWNPPEADVA